MLTSRKTLGLILALLFNSTATLAQDSVDELKRRVEQLEVKVQLLERTLNTLLAENERGQSGSNRPFTSPSAQPTGASIAQKQEDMNDPFRVGVTWVGDVKGVGGQTAKWAISISERDGQRISGGMVVVFSNGEKLEMPFSGTAPSGNNGLVVMETALIGRQKYFARGRMQNGEMALTFKGTSKLGEDALGTAVLRPKN